MQLIEYRKEKSIAKICEDICLNLKHKLKLLN